MYSGWIFITWFMMSAYIGIIGTYYITLAMIISLSTKLRYIKLKTESNRPIMNFWVFLCVQDLREAINTKILTKKKARKTQKVKIRKSLKQPFWDPPIQQLKTASCYVFNLWKWEHTVNAQCLDSLLMSW